jgi:hypothetical protein
MMMEKAKGWILPITVTGLIIATVVGLLMLNFIEVDQFDRAKEKTLKEIIGQNASDDYKQGWNDAISRIDAWYHAGENATMTAGLS